MRPLAFGLLVPVLLGAGALGTATVMLLPTADEPAASHATDGPREKGDSASVLGAGSPGDAAAGAAPRDGAATDPVLSSAGRARGRRAAPTPNYPPRRLEHLRRARGWTAFLRTWHGLPPAATPEERRARLDAALAGLADPVVRQNVIFAAALLLPWTEARPWLEDLRRGPDLDDAEDALCALAFSGDEAAQAAFAALAAAPSGAAVRMLDSPEEHDALAAEGTVSARATLRAYRAIEALDRRPYFHMVPFLVTHDWSHEGSRALLAVQPREGLSERAVQALLEAWMARYPGHPGTDGMSLRVARLRLAAGDAAAAATWFARALGGPDQDRASRAQAPLVALAERLLSLEDLAGLAEAQGLGSPSRTLYRYARLRRLAAEVDFERACREAEAAAAHAEPDDVLAWAWGARWAAPVPRGLASGVTPLSPSDPLLHTTPTGPPPESEGRGTSLLGVRWNGWTDEGRQAPSADPWALDPELLARQFRAWEALGELERRAAAARGAARADLLYKQAALLYHDRHALFPCYGTHTGTFGSALDALDGEGGLPSSACAGATTMEDYARRAFAWERAIGIFEQIEREHPEYPAMDKVLFSTGLCFKRLVDYRPRGAWTRVGSWPPDAPREDPGAQAIRRCVGAFERVAREHPTSPLADDAARAAAWWRRSRPQAFDTGVR